jgi:predicted dehydrogenase
MGNSLDQATKLTELYAQNDDLIASVSFVHRFRPAFTRAYSLLTSHKLGDLVSVHEHFMYPGDDRVPRWVWDSTSSGGGILLYSGIHNLDRILWFVNGHATFVSGVIGTHSHDVDVEDGVCANMRFDNGTYASLVGNQPSSVVPATISRTEIYCTDGTIIVSNGTELTYANSDGEVFQENFDSIGHFEYQALNIVDAITNAKNPLVSLVDGVAAYQLADSIYRSHHEKK